MNKKNNLSIYGNQMSSLTKLLSELNVSDDSRDDDCHTVPQNTPTLTPSEDSELDLDLDYFLIDGVYGNTTTKTLPLESKRLQRYDLLENNFNYYRSHCLSIFSRQEPEQINSYPCFPRVPENWTSLEGLIKMSCSSATNIGKRTWPRLIDDCDPTLEYLNRKLFRIVVILYYTFAVDEDMYDILSQCGWDICTLSEFEDEELFEECSGILATTLQSYYQQFADRIVDTFFYTPLDWYIPNVLRRISLLNDEQYSKSFPMLTELRNNFFIVVVQIFQTADEVYHLDAQELTGIKIERFLYS